MSTFDILWQLVGGLIGLWSGRELVVLAMKERNGLDPDAMSYREYREERLPYMIFFGGLILLIIFSAFVFGPIAPILGLMAGIPIGYLLKGIWKINDKPLGDDEDDRYSGD